MIIVFGLRSKNGIEHDHIVSGDDYTRCTITYVCWSRGRRAAKSSFAQTWVAWRRPTGKQMTNVIVDVFIDFPDTHFLVHRFLSLGWRFDNKLSTNRFQATYDLLWYLYLLYILYYTINHDRNENLSIFWLLLSVYLGASLFQVNFLVHFLGKSLFLKSVFSPKKISGFSFQNNPRPLFMTLDLFENRLKFEKKFYLDNKKKMSPKTLLIINS